MITLDNDMSLLSMTFQSGRNKLQLLIENRVPWITKFLEPISRYYLGLRYKALSSEELFLKIYKKHYWGGKSRSGLGSDLTYTKALREKFPKLLKELDVHSILDIPCGDFNWLKEVNLDFIDYVGCDIVNEIIINNNKNYSNKNKRFLKLDIKNDDLPSADLILCKDLMQHLSFEDIWKTINNIKKTKAKFLLASSNIETKTNSDIVTGGSRKINLLAPPFSFPSPIQMINEENPIKLHRDKRLLLWEIKSL